MTTSSTATHGIINWGGVWGWPDPNSRLHRRQLQYLVLWKGYHPIADATCEPVTHSQNALEAIWAFHQRYPKKSAVGLRRRKIHIEDHITCLCAHSWVYLVESCHQIPTSCVNYGTLDVILYIISLASCLSKKICSMGFHFHFAPHLVMIAITSSLT